MSYPTMGDLFRAQVIFQGPTGLAEDVYVNTLYFRNDEPELVGNPSAGYDEMANRLTAVLDAFYNQANGASLTPLANYLWGTITSVTYKFTDLGYPPPRYPVVEPHVTNWTPPEVGEALPGEVACCLSFKSGNGPRRRGRIYLGPFEDLVVTSTFPPHPIDDLMTAIGESALNMLNTAENVTWCQVSPTAAEFHPVTDIWVDNAFDTQRSRGVAPTSRRRWDTTGELV